MLLFSKVLIANRGEIALRVIRACRELGLQTVAVYSEADRDALHVRFADEDVCIGPPPAKASYLDIKQIIAAAEVTNAGAIHPGYGFLAENADFAEICESCGLVFIGPTPEQIRSARRQGAGQGHDEKGRRPGVSPVRDGVVASFDVAAELAEQIGYPVILKAVAGGGGKGMRICRDMAELERGFHLASAEAGNAFGNPDLYLEKVVLNPHHVEIQVLGDTHGNYYHFGERDCSIQRRHQKLIEETPSPLMTPDLRLKMGHAAVEGARPVQYRGVGTMEFLVDDNRKFYFMEMNTRIQVEHPITEEAYEVDLVKDQIRVAMGARLTYKQEELKPKWAAIECRINAEDVENDFRPTPGTITAMHIPGGPGVRVDRAVYTGYTHPAVLRFDDRQADCQGADARGCGDQDAPFARGVRDRGRADDDPVPQGNLPSSRLCGGQLRHQFYRDEVSAESGAAAEPRNHRRLQKIRPAPKPQAKRKRKLP